MPKPGQFATAELSGIGMILYRLVGRSRPTLYIWLLTAGGSKVRDLRDDQHLEEVDLEISFYADYFHWLWSCGGLLGAYLRISEPEKFDEKGYYRPLPVRLTLRGLALSHANATPNKPLEEVGVTNSGPRMSLKGREQFSKTREAIKLPTSRLGLNRRIRWRVDGPSLGHNWARRPTPQSLQPPLPGESST